MTEREYAEHEPLGEDVEGHRIVRGSAADGDDVEGHARRMITEDTDDVEGHARRMIAEDDDVEGHVQPPRDLDIDR